MKFIITICSTLIFSITDAQEADVSGIWNGNSYYLKTQIQTTYEIKQNGKDLSGFVYTKNGQDSAKMTFNGSITGNRLKLLTESFIYKVGDACLSEIILDYQDNGSFKGLSGKWQGTFSFKTCVPGVSGRVELFKSLEPIVSTDNSSVTRTLTLSDSDFEGQAMLSELSQRTYHALFISVQDYDDPEIVDLSNPTSDLNQLKGVLSNYYSFGEEHIYTLINPKRENIIETLDQLAGKVGERDNLLIFYAGHGVWDDKLNQGYWLPKNASKTSKANWISNSTIRDYIGGISSRHTLLITDACFSGSIFKERAVYANSKAVLEMYKLPSRKAMTSGALNTVPDKSVFIQYLVKNLKNNELPFISAEHLFQRFKIAVINNSPNGQVPQYGPIGKAGDEGGDFIFMKKSN